MNRVWHGRAGRALVSLAAVVGLSAPAVDVRAHGDDERSITIAVGGDVLLGGRMNGLAPQAGAPAVLADAAPELRAADLAIANLESVVATGGKQGVEKGQTAPLYFRGRPEMLGILTAAGIDAVTTANNHSGDYGPEALLESDELLAAASIAHPGSGTNVAAACRPAILEANGIRVAVFAVDTTQFRFAATERQAGTCHLGLNDRGSWERTFRNEIARVRETAHVVLFFVHWGPNYATAPIHDVRHAARRIVGLGADAIIGSNAHRIQGLEIIQGRPVIYDLGSLLFDFPHPDDSVVWELNISPRGVEHAAPVPLVAETGRTRVPTAAERGRILDSIAVRSGHLGTELAANGVELAPAQRAGPPLGPEGSGPAAGSPPAPLRQPPSECSVATLPAGITAVGEEIGPFTLVAVRVEPTDLVEPAILWVETFWTVRDPPTADYWLTPRAYPTGSGLTAWGDPHQPCDWQWPAERWESGIIYRDRVGVRPADSVLRLGGIPALLACGFCGPLEVRIGLEEDGRLIGETATVAEVSLGPPLPLRVGLIGLGAALVVLPAVGLSAIRRRRRPRSVEAAPA